MRNRLMNYDLLRIFAAYLIVMLHLSVQYIHQAPASYEAYTQWKYAIAFSAFSRIGVPIFIMLSGLFLLNPNKNISILSIFTKYLPKIILIFLFWTFFYAFAEQDFYGQLFESNFQFQHCWAAMDHTLFWDSVLRGNYHMWYLYMLAGLYLITPFVRIIATHATKRQFVYFTVLCMGITFVTKFNEDVWHIKSIAQVLDTLSLTFAFGYVGYFLAGFFLDKLFGDSLFLQSFSCFKQPLHFALKSQKEYYWRTLKYILNAINKQVIVVYILGIAGFIFTVFWTIQANPMFGFRVPELILFSNYSPTIFLLSFAVFTSTARWKDIRFPKVLRIIAKRFPQYMLLVYMIHPFIIVETRHSSILMETSTALSLPVNAFIIFLISLLVSILLKQSYKILLRVISGLFKCIIKFT